MVDERQAETTASAATSAPASAGTEAAGRGEQAVPAGPEAAVRPAMTDLEKLRFRCLRNAAYHEDRETHFARMHRFILFVIVITGTSAFAQVSNISCYLAWLTPEVGVAVATIAGLADLVFDISGKARQHATLRWRALDVHAGAQAASCNVADLEAALARLYTDEPPTYHAVNCLADNAASKALGGSASELWVVSSTQRMLRHWRRFTIDDFKQRKDVGASPAK